jgi:hypothetical protein
MGDGGLKAFESVRTNTGILPFGSAQGQDDDVFSG